MKPQLEGKIVRVWHAAHHVSFVKNVDIAWRMDGIDTKRRHVESTVGFVIITTMNAIIRRECPDGEARLQTLPSSE
jgi:hypothetical protein